MPEEILEPTIERSTHSPQIAQQFQASGVAQVIVVLKQLPVAAAALTSAAASHEAAFANLSRHFVTSELSQESAVLSALGTATPRAAAALSATRKPKAPPLSPVRMFPNLGVMLGTVSPAGLNGLRNENEVSTVTGAPTLTLIRPRAVAAVKSQPQVTWGLKALDVQRLWSNGITGEGVVVAHLDTGLDGKHPALKNAIAAFAEFDGVGDQVVPNPKPHDTDTHGTHTAATIAGRAVKGLTMGVAPGAKLASAIVIEFGNVVARVLAGLNWVLDQNPKVLSMSLGLVGWHDDFLPVIQILRTRGVLPVIASGNEGPGTSRSPGNYAESLSVGAVDRNLQIATFSSSQRFARPKDPQVPDLVGPGVDVISAAPGGKFATMSGTSMATPHIAGLAALLFQAKPGATIDEVEEAILGSCSLAPGMLSDRAGHGFPNAVKAFETLTGRKLTASVGSSPKAPARKAPKPHKSATPRPHGKKKKGRGARATRK